MKDFTLKKYRTDTIKASINGVDDWTDINAKLIAVNTNGDIVLEEDGVINGPTNSITFDFDFDETSAISDPQLYYEVVLYKDDKSFVKTALTGSIKIQSPYLGDPTL